jgi:hypothetical protein
MIHAFPCFRYRLHLRFRRWRHALAYATSRLSSGEAQTILIECQDYAGWYPLNTLCVDDLLDHAVSLYGDSARLLKPYLDAACERTARKWDCGDELNIALGFALEAALDSAGQDGIEIDGGKATNTSNPSHEGENAYA